MLDYPFTITVKVRRSGGVDRFGDPKTPTVHEIAGCVKWPTSSTENADFSQQVSTGYQLAIPAGADLLNADDVLFPGEDEDGPWWAVDGEPLPWGPSPFTGREPGAVASLVRDRG